MLLVVALVGKMQSGSVSEMRTTFGRALCAIYTFLQPCFQVVVKKTNINFLITEIIEKVCKIFLVISGEKRPFAKSRVDAVIIGKLN